MKRKPKLRRPLDPIDAELIRTLSVDARIAVKKLAKKVGLSAPSTTERIRRLEDLGIIQGYSARLDPSAIGLPMVAYLRIRPMPGELTRVAKLLSSMPQVVSCDRVTGDDCFIAKALVPTIAELEGLIDRLLPLSTTNTSIVVSTTIQQRLPYFEP